MGKKKQRKQKKVVVDAADIHTVVAGSLDEFNHKRKMANDADYREENARPPVYASMSEMLGLTDGDHISMRTACGV